jgi:hypothetical protein
LATSTESIFEKKMNGEAPAVFRGWQFLYACPKRVALISMTLLVPCFWQRHIEAGDLGSHVYNAWLAQLIHEGQAPGLYLAHQWHNVLFDVFLLQVANFAGFIAAEKIAVSLAVLIFFWSVFALLTALCGQSPWFLTPGIAMLAYGYSFSMGFLNYYLSVGLACWSLAIFLAKGRAKIDLLIALAILPFIYAAHPIGFLFALSATVYLALRNILPGYWKFSLPIAAVAAAAVLHWILAACANLEIDWTKDAPFYAFNGADQLVLYGDQYSLLVRVAILFGVICLMVDGLLRRREKLSGWKILALPVEFYVVAFAIPALLPENLRTSPDKAWIGLLTSRLTIITAIFGLAVLGSLRPRKWHLAGFVLLAAGFFFFLHVDMTYLNLVEGSAENLLWRLPHGTRVIPKLSAMPDSRIEFVGHLADRACIAHCFTYLNYEPPSKQFRVRALAGSPIAVDSYAHYEAMTADTHVFQARELPLTLLYECDGTVLTRLCLLDLAPGQTTESAIMAARLAAAPAPSPMATQTPNSTSSSPNPRR